MENFSWQITSSEKRKRVQKLIRIIWLPLIIFGVLATTIGQPALFTYHLQREGVMYLIWRAIYVVIGIGGGCLLYFIFNKILPYHNYSYSLDDNGITIAKGKKQRYFNWNNFEYFYPYSRRYGQPVNYKIPHPILLTDQNRQEIFQAGRTIMGEIFYLKERSKNFLGRLYKSFVVIHSESENNTAVFNFLSNRLPKRDMKNTSDLGMVFYKFK